MQSSVLKNIMLSERDFRTITDLVYEHCGIDLHKGKKELVRARLAKLLRKGNFKSVPEYMDYVLADKSGEAFSILINSLSTNLTSFFREKKHFDYLHNVFLPSIMQRKRKKHNFKIRGWSAGCSSGEEPYSIAITLLDTVHGQGQWDIKVLATDISTSILEIGIKGIYDKKRIEPLTLSQKNKYLRTCKVDGHTVFEVKQNLRNVVVFRYLNLMEKWPINPAGGLDFIFCRNVMIYFDKPTQASLINRFWDIMDSGGILFTGHSESLAGIEHKFKYLQPTIYTKS